MSDVDGLGGATGPGRDLCRPGPAAIDLTHRLQLAECDGTTVGYALSGPADGEADSAGELDAVHLLPSAQGLGVGRLLVEDALSGLAGAGYAECLLWVADQNAHARGFYQHLGFRSDGGRDVWRGLPVVRYRRVFVGCVGHFRRSLGVTPRKYVDRLSR